MSQQKWYYINPSMQKVGPITSQALKVLVENGIVNRKTTLILEDGSKMTEAGRVRGLFPEVVPPPSVSIPPASGESPLMAAQTPADPWNTPSNPFPSGIDSPDPFAAAARQASFDRAPVRSSSSEPTPLMICGGAGLLVVVFCAIVFGIAMLVYQKPAEVAGQETAETAEETVADPPAEKAEPVDTKSVDPEAESPFVEMDEKKEAAEETPAKPGKAKRLGVLKPPGGPRPLFFAPDKAEEEPKAEPAVALPVKKERQGKRDTEEIVAETEGSVALISGKRSSGSGFVVLPGILATNSHVIGSESINEIEVLFPSETGIAKGPFKAKLLYEDVKRDLAFLEISSKDHAPLQVVQDYRFRRGQRVIAIGNPGIGDGQILENAVSEGILSTQTEVEDMPFYQLSISINVGNSGGPVFTDEGDVLGVVTLKGTQTEGVAFCIPPDALNDAVETVRRADANIIEQARSKHEDWLYLHRGVDRLRILNQIPQMRIREFAQESLKDFDEAVKRVPKEADAFLGRGIFRAILGDMEGTISDFESAARLAPERRELAELRDLARNEREKQRHLAAAGGHTHFISIDQLRRVRPGMGGGVPVSPQEIKMREHRYQQILRKEEWTFNGKKLQGRLVGYEDGIAHFRTGDDESGESVKRYANRFSRQDIADIIFYARYNGIPLGNLKVK